MTHRPCAPEDERLAALRAYGMLDTPPEDGFEHITAVITRLFNAPIAAITLVDAERQWFKSMRGLAARETPRDQSFCAHAMLRESVMVVPDAQADPRFAANNLVTGPPYIRFYAGAPLRTPEGYRLGALCVIDTKPRDFNRSERKILAEMAALVEDELLLRRAVHELRTKVSDRKLSNAPSSNHDEEPRNGQKKRRPQSRIQRLDLQSVTPSRNVNRFRHIVEQAEEAIFVYDLEGRFIEANSAACQLYGYTPEELLRMTPFDLDVGFNLAKARERWQEMELGKPATAEGLNLRKNRSVFWAEAKVSKVETEEGVFLLALVRDTTARRQAETLLLMRARQQKAVAELGQMALRGGKIEALMDEAVVAVSETLEIEICRVLEHIPERGEIVTRAGLNLSAHEKGAVAATDNLEHAAGHVLSTGKPLIIENVLTNQRFRPTPWLIASGAVSGLHVSIGGDGSHCPRYGLLAAYTRENRIFTDDDVYFVQSVANILATAITRQRGEDALRSVEARYQRIAAHTPGVVYQCLAQADGTLEIPFISEGCRKLYGKDPAEIKAQPKLLIEAVHPDERAGFVEAFRQAKQTLTDLHWQGRLQLPNDHIRWVRFDSRPERLPDGGVICDGMIVDISEEETRKEALRQSEKRFRLANFHAPFPTMILAGDGEILLVNDAWTHITGYTSEELRTMEDWVQRAYSSEEQRERSRCALAEMWQHIGVAEFEDRRIRCANGEERIWELRCVNLDRLPDGRWLHLVSAIDVTDRRQAETVLRLAKEEAERANAAKSVFLSRMSHELRTPLNAILGFGQLLELGSLDDENLQSVEQILKGGRHLLSLVDEVLDLARVESGEIELHCEPVAFAKLARECVNLVARTAQASGVICQVSMPRGGLRLLLADEHRLRQVLLNLLSNAIKYHRDGGRVTLSYEKRPDNRARVSIADNGPGMSAEDLARLFVPFERLGQELTTVEGTGLGLVISKQLVEAMGGTIGVESEVGRGSVFWIELPTAEGEEPKRINVQASPARPAAICAKPRAATILYVEDNPSNAQVVKILIERLRPEWTFLSAADGLEGLQMVRDHRPDVMLLDLQLPKLKGDAMLEKLREDRDTRDIPVLLLSADATAHSRERLLALGANEYLAKPFDVRDLLDKIDGFVDRACPPTPA